MESGGGSPGLSRWSRVARELLPLLVLLTVSVKSTFDEWRARDLTGTDETLYLTCAWNAAHPGDPPPESSPLYVPLYAGWYRLLMYLPVEVEYLPFVSHGALMTVLAGLFYAIVRRLGTGRWVAVAASSLLILNTHLAAIEPFPVHMATALLALGVLVGTYRRSLLGACGPIGFGALAACYARNEFGTFLLAFLPLYLAGGVWAWRRQAACVREFLPWAVPLVVSVGVCSCTLGVPLPDGPRGIFAFGQHYARNVVEARGGDLSDWVVHFERVLHADFGDVKTVGEAVRARPDAVAWHVGRNLSRLPTSASDLCRPRAPLAGTPRRPVYLLMLAGLAIGFVGVVRRVRSGGLRGLDGQPLRAVMLALACVAVISGPSVLLIFPRDHYLLLPLFFLLALAVSGLPSPRWPTSFGAPDTWKIRAAGLAVGALLVGATPTAMNEWTFLRPLLTKTRTPTSSFEARETMALLRSLPRRPGTVVTDCDHSSTVVTLWMAQPVLLIPREMKAESFWAFVAKHGIEVVLLDSRLPSDPRFGGDPEFMALWNGTDTGNFVVLSSPGGARIAVRKDLLE